MNVGLQALVFAGSIAVFLGLSWGWDEWKRYRTDRRLFELLRRSEERLDRLRREDPREYVVGCKCSKCLEARTRSRSRWL
jgi:hypothetical protein